MRDQIDEVIQRTQRYWYSDGLADIGTGAAMLVFALANAVVLLVPPAWAILAALLQPVIILAGWWGIGKIVKRLKETITYPRTGYVSFPRKKKSRKSRVLIAGLTAALVGGLVAALSTFEGIDNLIPLLVSFLVGSTVILIGYRVGIVRYYLVGIAIVASGPLLAASPVPTEWRSPALLTIFGIWWLISGIFTLVYYLSRTSRNKEELA